MMKTLMTTIALLLSLTACGASTQQLESQQTRVTSLKKELRVAKAERDALRRFQRGLSDGSSPWFALSKSELKRLMRAYMPYRFAGRDLSKKRLKGKLSFEDPRNLELNDNNQLRFKMTFRGERVKANLKGIFMAGKSDEKKIKQALEAGGTVEIESQLYLDRSKKNLLVKSRCVAVRLKRHNTKRHRDYLKDGINRRFLKYPKKIPLPASLTALSPRLFVTPTNIVFIGQ